MRRLQCVLLAAVAIVGFTSIASAADMPVKAPAPIAAPVYNWTGWYVGINGGYGWNNSSGDGFCTTPGGVVGGAGCAVATPGTVKPAGGLFGAQIGYNFQAGSIVYGIEADFQWSGIKDSASVTALCCVPAPVPAGTYSASQDLQWFGTLRGRLGFVAFDRGLIYGTGGLFYGHESVSSLMAFPLISYPASTSSTRAGWTLGGGFEYAFTQTITGKIEGLYYDMGSQTIAFTSPATNFTESATFNYRGTIVRGGLNFRF